jgi:hypothetical protein
LLRLPHSAESPGLYVLNVYSVTLSDQTGQFS